MQKISRSYVDDIVRLIIPGLVIQAVMVGGGYATGRELVEFFVKIGPSTGLFGIIIAGIVFSIASMISFELGRIYGAFDYYQLSRTYLGFASPLFEAGYIAFLLLVLSIVSAAAGRITSDALAVPPLIGILGFMMIVAALVLFGSTMIERIISVWSLIFYVAYGSLFAFTAWRSGSSMWPAKATGVDMFTAAQAGLSYAGYNVVLVPVMIFVARNFKSRKEALIGGAIAGPLMLLPGVALFLVLMAYADKVTDAPVPVLVVLHVLDIPVLSILIQLVIAGALIKTGVGMLHGLNERLEKAAIQRGWELPGIARGGVALVLMLSATFLATSIGLIDLIAHGYRYASLFFFATYLLPLCTVGLWRLSKHRVGA